MRKEFLLITILGIIIIVLLTALIFAPKSNNADVKNLSVKAGQEISGPLVVEGEAAGVWFFEASFPIKIIDERGNVLGSSFVRAEGDWMTENFVPFRGEITYASKAVSKGFLILSKDNPSGLAQYDRQVKIPVVLAPAGYAKIKVYFNNSKMDPEASCNKVFATEREILKIEAIGSAAVWELLKGPTNEEQKAGFFTSISSGTGVTLQSLDIDKNGVARADFDEQLEKAVGGSCRVSAIRAQITQTLLQFETIKSVVISIDGRTEDILQP